MPEPCGEKDGFEVWLIDETYSAEAVAAIWPRCEQILLAGKKHWQDWMTIEEIRRDWLSGGYQLWFVTSPKRKEIVFVLLTQVVDFPRGRCIEFVIGTGKGKSDWVDLIVPTAERVSARLWNTTSCGMLARFGWKRELAKQGYRAKKVYLLKTFETESESYG